MFQEDLDAFMADFAGDWFLDDATFAGILSQPDEQLPMGSVNVKSTMYELEVQTSVVIRLNIRKGAQLANQQQYSIDRYEVRDVLLTDDGAFTKLTLSKV